MNLADSEMFADLETAAGVPFSPDLRESLLVLIRAEEWGWIPPPTTRETVAFWAALAKSASQAIKLVEGERGRSLAARETLATFAEYRTKGLLPDHLPKRQLVTDGLNWDHWWQATSDLLKTIEMTAEHQAARATSERQGKSGRRPLTTVQSVRDHLRQIYHHAVVEHRERSGTDPANREEAFIKAVSEHLPLRLRGQTAEDNASRERKKKATKKHRSKVKGRMSKS